MRQETRLALLLGTLSCATPVVADEAPKTQEDIPSIELLEYLADYEEDEQGHLLDPLAGLEVVGDDRHRDDRSREEWWRQSDR